jgi:hypothetical protein
LNLATHNLGNHTPGGRIAQSPTLTFIAFPRGRHFRPKYRCRARRKAPKEAWLKVLERLYHEDHILYARMNNFSTVQAFLATALAFTTARTITALNISLIVSLFGLALSLFYISLGFRGVRVIQFWRAYLRLLESIPGVISIDSHLFEFYRLGHRRVARAKPNCRLPGDWPSRSKRPGGRAVPCTTNFPGTFRGFPERCSSPSASRY